jgi:hypothetical protein
MAEIDRTGDELNNVFKNGKIFNATDDDLNRYLQHLSSGHVRNESVRHREMNRCQVINTIKTFRLIDNIQSQNQELEKENKALTRLNIVLAGTAIIVSFFSYWQSQDIAKSSSEQVNELISVQETRFAELIELEKENVLHFNKLNATNKQRNTDSGADAPPPVR